MQASVCSCDSIVLIQTGSLSDKQSDLSVFLCFAHEALGKATLISWPLNILVPSFPESSIFSPLFVILYKWKKKKKEKEVMKMSPE